jgi:hypothetical protein
LLRVGKAAPLALCTLQLRKQVDVVVLQAYGFSPDDDLLEKLLALNLELAEKEKNGEAVVGPWDPTTPYPPLISGVKSET